MYIYMGGREREIEREGERFELLITVQIVCK